MLQTLLCQTLSVIRLITISALLLVQTLEMYSYSVRQSEGIGPCNVHNISLLMHHSLLTHASHTFTLACIHLIDIAEVHRPWSSPWLEYWNYEIGMIKDLTPSTLLCHLSILMLLLTYKSRLLVNIQQLIITIRTSLINNFYYLLLQQSKILAKG